MISFRAGVFVGMTAGATLVTTYLCNRPYYGLFSGVIQSAIAIGVRELLGKPASEIYIAGVVIYSLGVVGNKALKSQNKKETPSSQATLLEEAKNFSCPIAQSTGKALAEGFYTGPSGKKIPLRSGAQLLEGSRSISHAALTHPMKSRYEKSEIVVVEQDCLYAAEMELKNGAKKVAVLMLASPIEPGGAMEEGNNGQEEELCRRSNIFGFMWDQARGFAKTFLYNLVDVKIAHQVNPEYASMTNNRMIHVPQVTVFRSGKDANYKMLETPFEVGMLISPGLDRPEYDKACFKRTADQEQLLKVLSTQLTVAYEENYDTVILGAFGCGAFFNPPDLIADSYKTIIDTYFKAAFKKITFAILDNDTPGKHNPEGNLKPFQQCFESPSQASVIPTIPTSNLDSPTGDRPNVSAEGGENTATSTSSVSSTDSL